MTRRILLLGLVLLVGCNADDYTVVRKTPAGTRTATQTVSCTHYDYCYGCDTNYQGKMECSYGFRNCDGHRSAVVTTKGYVVRYKSGRLDTVEESGVDKYLTDCK